LSQTVFSEVASLTAVANCAAADSQRPERGVLKSKTENTFNILGLSLAFRGYRYVISVENEAIHERRRV
jgi:hypothetical protein